MKRWYRLAGLTATLLGCDPRFVETEHEVDAYIARGAFSSACVGLKMKNDPDLRTHTAKRLADWPDVPDARSCLCEALVTSEGYDAAVAAGIKDSKRDDLADCLAPALDKPLGEDRLALVLDLGHINAPRAYALMADLVKSDPDPTIRATAVELLRPSDEHLPVVLAALAGDADPKVRAAAASALATREGREARDALIAAVQKDESGPVRAAALKSVSDDRDASIRAMICSAMMDDADETMRAAAAAAFDGSRNEEEIACLRRRLLTEEPSGTVRAATMASLGSSPRDSAAKALCDAIGPFMKMYVKDQIADRIEAVNIVQAQNNRDWENSYTCVQRALSQGGLSCYARNHLGGWFRELGGSAPTPWCPGMIKNE